VGGGGRSTKVKLAPDALRRLPNVTVVPGLAMDVTATRSNDSDLTATRSNDSDIPA